MGAWRRGTDRRFLMSGMKNCKHKKYATSIGARKGAEQAGGKGLYREVEKCDHCGKWRVREGIV